MIRPLVVVLLLVACLGAVWVHFAARLQALALRAVAGFAFAVGLGLVTRAAAATGFALGLGAALGFATVSGFAGLRDVVGFATATGSGVGCGVGSSTAMGYRRRDGRGCDLVRDAAQPTGRVCRHAPHHDGPRSARQASATGLASSANTFTNSATP
jgi:hypothetical protein